MNGYKHIRSVAVVEFDHLLRLTVHRCGHQPAKLRNTVIAMHHVVTYLQLVDLAQGDDRFSASRVLTRHLHAVETLEDLVVRVAAYLQLLIHKPIMQRCVDRNESYRRSRSYSASDLTVALRRSYSVSGRLEDRFESIKLFLLLGEDIDFVSIVDMFAQILRQDIELLMEYRLRYGIKTDLRVLRKRTLLGYLNRLPVCLNAEC